MKKLIILALLVLMVPLTISDDDNELPWYAVEDWEVEVCSKWGGTAEAQQYHGVATGSTYMFETTVTLQGQRMLVQEAGVNKTLYEAAWYFRPLDKQQAYSIVFVGNTTKVVYKASSSPETGDANYYAEESTEKYHSVRMVYETGTLTVPFVEK